MLAIAEIGNFYATDKLESAIDIQKKIFFRLQEMAFPLSPPHPSSLNSQNTDKVKYRWASQHNSTQIALQPAFIHPYLLAGEIE